MLTLDGPVRDGPGTSTVALGPGGGGSYLLDPWSYETYNHSNGPHRSNDDTGNTPPPRSPGTAPIPPCRSTPQQRETETPPEGCSRGKEPVYTLPLVPEALPPCHFYDQSSNTREQP